MVLLFNLKNVKVRNVVMKMKQVLVAGSGDSSNRVGTGNAVGWYILQITVKVINFW